MRYIYLLIFALFISQGAGAVTANFTADFPNGCAPHVVHFTNTSTGATSYSWNLGNGIITPLTNPSTSYLAPGTYTVTLTAYDGGASDTKTMVITVHNLPTVDFFASITAICPGAPVTFTSTSTPGVPGAMTYLWNFGDGTTSTLASPSHTFTTPGYYNISLTVTNSQGCSKTYTRSAYIQVYSPPAVNFVGSPLTVCNPPATVTFTSYTTGTAPLTHTWVWGPGITTSGVPGSYTYTAPGTYDVKLIVTDGNGCKDSLNRPGYIFVGTINASFTHSPSGCVGAAVLFTNTSTTHTSRSWNYGDGSPLDTALHGNHTYTTAGTYTVTFTITNGPCTDVETHVITVYPKPTGTFSIAPANPCPAPVTMTYVASAPAGSTLTWLYEGGATGSGTTGTHTYGTDGIKEIKMVIADVNGCIDTITRRDTLYDLYFMAVPIPQSGCVPLTVNFSTVSFTTMPDSANHPYPFTISGFTWGFGDGSPGASGPTTSHTYTAVGVYIVTVTATTANGCVVTDTTHVLVGTPPQVTFTAAPTHICYGDSVEFTAHIITGPVSVYEWQFGDGNLSTSSPGVTRYYNMPGFFTVTVTPYYNGCPGPPYIGPYTIIVDSPKAIIMYSMPCTPLTRVNFTNASLGDDSHLWMFGDGATSTLDNPVHDYPSLGTYTVTLATYNATSGCRDTARLEINLNDPIVDFTADDTTQCEGGIVNYTVSVTGGAIGNPKWYVNWVRNDWDTGMTFTDTFNTAGLYTISLEYVNERGCTDTLTKTNYIIVGRPVANFTVVPMTGCWPLSVTFTDISTDVPGLFMTGFEWDFGDGSTAVVTTPATTHVYTNVGTFTVQEIVTDNIGCKDTAVQPNVVTVWRPNAIFSASNTHPCKHVPVTFTSGSTGVVSHFWMFGDGGTASGPVVTHAYAAAGNYTVKLVVTDSHGCTDTASYSSYIIITQPTAAFTPSDTFSVCSPLTVTFVNTSVGGTGFAWDFGDGNVSTLHTPSNVYLSPGLYTARLIATNAYGCADTATRVINIYGYAGSLSYTPLTGCAPLTVHFSAAISNVPHIIWDFGDGTTSVLSSVDTASHTYTLPGGYVPKLILSDNTGCQNSVTGIDTIKVDAITVKIGVSPAACIGTPFNFVDSSTWYWSPVNSWVWTYDGITSTDESPTHQVNSLGSFPVTLTVTNGWGCTATLAGSITIRPLPEIHASPDTVVCVGDPATLFGYGAVSYSWGPAATVSCVDCNPTTATPPVVTTYSVIGTDEWGCKDTASVKVGLRTHTIANAWGDTTICGGITVPLFDTGGHTYQWLPPGGLSNSTIWNPLATPASTITYTVIAQLGGCIPDTDYVKVEVRALPSVDAGADQEALAGTPVPLSASGQNTVAWEWTPSTGLSCNDCPNPDATVNNTTTFYVTGISQYGCRRTDSVRVSIFCHSKQAFLPTVFTPNNDGLNDVFYPRGTGLTLIKSFRIYNRWGELLFERENIMANDASNAWDGNYKGDGPHPDVYVYVVEAICSTGEPVLIKGDVTIVR